MLDREIPIMKDALRAGVRRWREMQTPDPPRDERKARAKESQEFFETYYLADKLKAKSAAWQHELGTLRRHTVVMAPRGHGKTTHILFVQPLREALLGPAKFLLVIGQNQEKAIKALDAIKRQLETNGRIRGDFGDLVNSRWWKADIMELRNGHVMQALGWDQCSRGVAFDLRRPDIILADDPETLEEAMSQYQREKTEDVFLSEVIPALAAEGYAKLVGTVLNDQCLVARIARNPMWSRRKYEAIIREADRQDLWESFRGIWMTAEGEAEEKEKTARTFFEANTKEMMSGAEVLWPEMWNYYRLTCRRLEIGTHRFNAEYQQKPVDEETAIFKPRWFARVRQAEVAEIPMRRIVAVDPALGRRVATASRNQSCDPSAIAVLGMPLNGAGCYVLEYDERVRSVRALCEDILRHEARNGRAEVFVEDVAFQAVLKTVLEEMSARMGRSLSVRSVPTEGVPKEIRIMRLPARVEDGWLKWVTDGPGVETAIAKMQQWKPGEEDDHAPDVIEMGIRATEQRASGPGMRLLPDVW